jgi:tetratricopeptide (TPR) repeat protein/predicted aspartyl protease
MRKALLACFPLLIGATLFAPSGFAASKCELGRAAELSITMRGLRPTIATKINGKDATFVLDSGAFFTTLTADAATQYGVSTSYAPFGFRIEGIGGAFTPQIGRAKTLELAGVTLQNVDFFVGGNGVGGVGLLGQNLLENFDVEYDLGNGAVRLYRTNGCEHANLAYWVKSDQSFSTMPIDAIDRKNAHTVGVAYINGQKIRIAFDTGAYTSILSISAAAKVGVKPDSNGVVAAGYSTGVGRGTAKSYIARFDTFKVGDGEEIKNARIRIADMDLKFADMLLGADFFISHRIFVGNHEHRLFLSYNGGPVFDLTSHEGSAPDAKPGTLDAANPPANSDEGSADPAELARRGSAMAARHEFAPALESLSKAIELSPNEPEYYYERANVYWSNKQPDMALADFSRVIELKQDFLPAYLPRARLYADKKDNTAALSDLETVDRLAPKSADLRFTLAGMYEFQNRLPESLANYGQWIDSHPDDSRIPAALSGRCWNRALLDQELPAALSDCSTAIRRSDKGFPGTANMLANRGLVQLRLKANEKAINDCNEALKVQPKLAKAMYIRGLAEGRMNKKTNSDADMAAAKELAPRIVEFYAKYGLTQ